MSKFERDLASIVRKLCSGEDIYFLKEMNKLKNRLVSLHEMNVVKINHSVLELVCAKYLVLAGFEVYLEHILNGVSCDVYASKGFGGLVVEIETGFIPPQHALDPSTYIKARIASKITRYSGFAEKFGLATPPYYLMQIPPTLIKSPRDRVRDEIREVKALCDLYYSNPPVSLEEIKNARIHAIYTLNVDEGSVKETEPVTYAKKVRSNIL